MADNARGVHVSPGIYTREVDAQYAVRSLGITTLGVVGETLKGPAFQPISISNWNEFKEIFGGTSTEKFKGSQYPKYELPYIAKSYLSESEQLKVVRVLGLSGYDAGPAWLVTASDANGENSGGTRQAVAVIRSRGHYTYYNPMTVADSCQCENTKFDTLTYEVGEQTDKTTMVNENECLINPYNMNALQIRPYNPFNSSGNECIGYKLGGNEGTWGISSTNRGRFKLVGVTGKHTTQEVATIIQKADNGNIEESIADGYFEYSVSLNPADKDYILNVLGTKAYDGEAPIYVETLYDVALEQGISTSDLNCITSGLTTFNAYKTADYCHHTPVDGIVNRPQNVLTRSFVGNRYLANIDAPNYNCVPYDYESNEPHTIEWVYNTYGDEADDKIKNEKPRADLFTYKYVVPNNKMDSMPKSKAYNNAYYNRGSHTPVCENDLSGYSYTVSFKNPDNNGSNTIKILCDDDADHLKSTDFLYKVNGDTGATLNIPEDRFLAVPHHLSGITSNPITAYTYTIPSAKSSVTSHDCDINLTSTLNISDSTAKHHIDPETFTAEVTKSMVYSSETYTYSSVQKEYPNGQQLFGDNTIKKLSGDTGSGETQEYKDWKQSPAELEMKVGQIYTVKQYTAQDGKRNYYYAYYDGNTVSAATSGRGEFDTTDLYGNLLSGGTTTDPRNTNSGSTLVLNKADGLYYRMNENNDDVVWVELDMNDYKSAYRYASTPWIVSNLKGDFNHIELNKLFRFHTISDGDNANYEVKVSIENIKPDDGVFDVVVRRIDDLDESIIPLEKFARCSMNPGDSNYIAYRIGSFDGVYESKSKFITVEVNDTTAARTSVPAGFLGYPVPLYKGTPIREDNINYEYNNQKGENYSAHTNVVFPTLKYNTSYDVDIKNRKQYFGLSSWVGVDIDNFTFKGAKTYINDPRYLTHGFHLDSRLDKTNRSGDADYTLTVDGENGYEFDCVSTNERTMVLDRAPIISKESDMYGSIYEYVNLRKFTVFFYGGFDGWDVYRDQRTNTDNFKMTQYRGYINDQSGEGYSFNKISDPRLLELNQNGITSDWYAYLSGIRQFATPEATDINVFATPGIDYVNQKLLVDEAIEMIEEERADSIYVITTPDKPSGAGDFVDEMYTPEDAVDNLDDSEIDSNYSCTYYPWVKYLDTENNQYIYLPATKDVVRNFAQTDNQSWPWFAPAGVERGNVDCVRAHFITKLADEDVLYEGRINPIKTFAQDGPKVWGQKNLQINESDLNRIAVRRLLLRLRKLIAVACIGLIFEPNDATIKQSFISTVTPILDSIRGNRGLSDYRIEVDDSLEARERRELPCKIFFKPYKALEYITIDFVLTPEGVSFDDI